MPSESSLKTLMRCSWPSIGTHRNRTRISSHDVLVQWKGGGERSVRSEDSPSWEHIQKDLGTEVLGREVDELVEAQVVVGIESTNQGTCDS